MRATLFGPVLYYDLLRTARRARNTVVRTLYALGLLSLFAFMYAEHPALDTATVPARELSRFATNFFYAFLIFQYVLAVLLTPAYVAGAIAEEKERRTLEFIMATDLRSREIVLSKFCSRVANLLMLLFAGLPVLSFIQFFGGVDPMLLWSGFAGTGMTILSIASLSILLSVYLSKARSAINRSFMVVILYIFLYVVFLYLVAMLGGTGIPVMTLTRESLSFYLLSGAFEIYSMGHPIHAVWNFIDFGGLGGSNKLTGLRLASSPLEVLRNFCLFHGILTLLFLSLSIWRLRPVFLRQAFAVVKTLDGKKGKAVRPRRPVGNAPMLWKELHIESGRTTWAARIAYALIVIACLAPMVVIHYKYWISNNNRYVNDLSWSIMEYTTLVGPVIAMIFLLASGSRAANAVGSERDRQTLESLLTTPLRLSEILLAKWLGAWWGTRPILALLALIWGVSLLSGGTTVLALMLNSFVLLIYGSQATTLGLFFGAWTRTTIRATVATAGTLIFLMGTFWFCCGPVVAMMREDHLVSILLGCTPPVVIGTLTTVGGKHSFLRNNQELDFILLGIVLGLGFALLTTLGLWFAALTAFRRQTGRLEKPLAVNRGHRGPAAPSVSGEQPQH